GRITVVAARDVVEVVLRNLVDPREQVAAVKRTLAVQRAALVDDGDQAGPRRSADAGAADLEKAAVADVVNEDARVRIGVEGHVGIGPIREALSNAALESGLGLELADAAAAATEELAEETEAPARFRQVIAVGIQV